jgi:hypothetical protein
VLALIIRLVTTATPPDTDIDDGTSAATAPLSHLEVVVGELQEAILLLFAASTPPSTMVNGSTKKSVGIGGC